MRKYILIISFVLVGRHVATAQVTANQQVAVQFTGKGIECYANDSLAKAITFFNIAIKMDSTYQEARYRRGNAFFDKPDLEKARADYQWLAYHHTSHADVYERLGDMDTTAHKYDEALGHYSTAIALNSSQGSYYATRGLIFFNLQKFDKAARDLANAVALNYTSADMYSMLGYALLRTGDNRGAVFYFSKAIELDPQNVQDYANRGDALVALHTLDAAKLDLLYYMKFDTTDYSVWYNLARAEYGLKEYDSAITSYKHVLRLKPGYGDTYFRMGISYADKGDFKDAADAFTRAIAQQPDAAYLYYNRAVARARLNNGSDYCTDLKKAADMGYEQAITMMARVCGK